MVLCMKARSGAGEGKEESGQMYFVYNVLHRRVETHIQIQIGGYFSRLITLSDDYLTHS